MNAKSNIIAQPQPSGDSVPSRLRQAVRNHRMKKYRLLMNGKNFLIVIDGKPVKHGFYQNIFVEAGSPEEAELIAVDRIRNNEELKQVVQNIKADPQRILMNEIHEIDSISESDRTMEKGRTFYREKRWWQIWNYFFEPAYVPDRKGRAPLPLANFYRSRTISH